MTFGRGHGTPLDQGQPWCVILTKSNTTVGSHGADEANVVNIRIDDRTLWILFPPLLPCEKFNY